MEAGAFIVARLGPPSLNVPGIESCSNMRLDEDLEGRPTLLDLPDLDPVAGLLHDESSCLELTLLPRAILSLDLALSKITECLVFSGFRCSASEQLPQNNASQSLQNNVAGLGGYTL